MKDLTDSWIDILTGHASARFKWIDVRSADARSANSPTGWEDAHIPLADLPDVLPRRFSTGDEFVVVGRDDAETAEAEKLLRSLGFKDVQAFRGGVDALRRAGLA